MMCALRLLHLVYDRTKVLKTDASLDAQRHFSLQDVGINNTNGGLCHKPDIENRFNH